MLELDEESNMLELEVESEKELELSNALDPLSELLLPKSSSNELLQELEPSNMSEVLGSAQNRLPPTSIELFIMGRPVDGLMP
jgi:hypothetical protein